MRAAVAEVYLPQGEIMDGTEPEPRISRVGQVSMIDRHEPHILVLTTEEDYVQQLRGMLVSPLAGATFVTQIEDVEAALPRLPRVDIALVDVASLGRDWPRLVAQIAARFQQVRCVAMIETDQLRLVETFLAGGMIDCIEKSAPAKMLQMRIGNLVHLKQLEQENGTLRAEQREKLQEIIELQRVMATMERNMERATKEVEYRIFTQIRSLVMPLFEEIAGQAYGQVAEEPLQALRKYVNDLASGLGLPSAREYVPFRAGIASRTDGQKRHDQRGDCRSFARLSRND